MRRDQREITRYSVITERRIFRFDRPYQTIHRGECKSDNTSIVVDMSQSYGCRDMFGGAYKTRGVVSRRHRG